jgi:hypothetical protein
MTEHVYKAEHSNLISASAYEKRVIGNRETAKPFSAAVDNDMPDLKRIVQYSETMPCPHALS